MSLQAHLKFAPVLGEVGIEIEVEGENLPTSGKFLDHWRVERDNSLRGEAFEYVLSNPVAREEVEGVLHALEKAYRSKGSKVHDSFRAGIHVHVNIQDLSPKQLMNFIFLYFMYEEPLIDFCAPSRRGNHFCLRAKDANYLCETLTTCIEEGNLQRLNSDDFRYSSINLLALFRYGSLEFRALESSRDWDKIQTWINLLLSLKDAAQTFHCPTDIIGGASVDGFEEFSRKVFGKNLKKISKHLSDDKLYEGIRNVQFAAYSRDWSAVNLNIFKAAKGSLF